MKIDSDFSTEKQCIVIDIGTKYTKFGFATEHSPRCIIQTQSEIDGMIVTDFYNCIDQQKLTLALTKFIHRLFYKHALIAPKEKKVIIVESLLSPTKFKETLAKILFINYEIASLCFVPSHCVALFTLGISTALVLDIGYKETILIPVCEGVPVLKLWQAMPLAGESVEKQIKNQINVNELTAEKSTNDIIEDIKVRSCFVTKLNRSKNLVEGKDVNPLTTDASYHINGEISITIPGRVRETAYDILFEENIDEMSITTMILETIKNSNVDMRLKLAENIFLIGGTTIAKGFKARLKEELQEKVNSSKYQNLKISKFKFHIAPVYENYVAWLGGSIFGSTNNLNILSQTRENFLKENFIPDWPTTHTRPKVEQ
ncbi:actin-related protein 10 [Daktulosphaira vitifoliae]|uniref:actin-related protein 10 n=1 Tax=Daktulosphaira vitifoliae TaxID=58002 RepID=UPI0021AA8477|nr:actin-related protein 10 [Daktulosphaira vitifoliae]